MSFPQPQHPPASQSGMSAPHGQQAAQLQNTVGSFEGCHYKIDHRDSNSILSVMLQQGYQVKSKPGAMVTMQGSVQIKGNFKFSLKKMISGGEMSESTFTGPGEVLLAPEIWGDIFPIQITANGPEWSVGKDAYLASTQGVVRSTKGQGLKQGIFSGEGFLVNKVSGSGIIFVQSLGAIVERHLGQGEELIVDNGHLVAWSCPYSVERIQGGGFISSSHTGEGMVCRFKGPGIVLIQTRNPEALGEWIAAQIPSRNSSG